MGKIAKGGQLSADQGQGITPRAKKLVLQVSNKGIKRGKNMS